MGGFGILAPDEMPRAVNAHVIGLAIFNDLQRASTGLERPTVSGLFSFKSPLTVWGEAEVDVSISGENDDIRLLYTEDGLQRFSDGIL